MWYLSLVSFRLVRIFIWICEKMHMNILRICHNLYVVLWKVVHEYKLVWKWIWMFAQHSCIGLSWSNNHVRGCILKELLVMMYPGVKSLPLKKLQHIQPHIPLCQPPILGWTPYKYPFVLDTHSQLESYYLAQKRPKANRNVISLYKSILCQVHNHRKIMDLKKKKIQFMSSFNVSFSVHHNTVHI